MATPPAAAPGLVGSLFALAEGLLATAEARVALAAVELQEEKLRLTRLLVWIGAGIFAGVMAATCASLLLVHLFWAGSRLAVLGGLTVFYLGGLAAIAVIIRRIIAREPRPFAATQEEIAKDRAWLRSTER